MITQQQLKSLFYYDKLNGIFICIKPVGKLKQGNIVGNKNHDGYVRLKINYKSYQLHRLAWLYVYGEFPKNEIDHINGIRYDNRIENLREATSSENARNKNASPRNTSNFKGVTYHKKSNKWQAQASHNNKAHYLGLFESKEMAYKEYCNFVKNNHGDFAYKNL